MKVKNLICVLVSAVMIFTALPFYAYAEDISAPYAENEVVIKYTSTVPADENFDFSAVPYDLASCSVTSLKMLDADSIFDTREKINPDGTKSRTVLLLGTVTKSVGEALRSLNRLEAVEYAEPNILFEEDTVVLPTEVSSPNSLYSTYTKWWFENALHIPEAWQRFDTMGEGTVVAVIDAGFYADNPEIYDNIYVDSNGYRGYCSADGSHQLTADSGHGSNVMGIIAGVCGVNKSLVGIAPKTKILPIKASAGPNNITLAAIVGALNYAVTMNVDIISMSISSGAGSNSLLEACTAVYDAGIIFVSSAGNNGIDATSGKRYPSSYSSVIGVMAYENVGTAENPAYRLADFSNFDSLHNSYDIVAPGTTILGLPASNTAINMVSGMNGTSQATPIIAGLAALYKSVYPDHTVQEFRRSLMNSAETICSSNPTRTASTEKYPVVNALDLLSYPNTMPYIVGEAGTTAYVDEERGYIYGLEEGYTDIEEFITVYDGTGELIENDNGNGTGSIFRVYTLSGEFYRDYEIVIFGDADGDCFCDGMDSVICDCGVNGYVLPDCVMFACDVDFDGEVTSDDTEIIVGCGIFADFVIQIR